MAIPNTSNSEVLAGACAWSNLRTLLSLTSQRLLQFGFQILHDLLGDDLQGL